MSTAPAWAHLHIPGPGLVIGIQGVARDPCPGSPPPDGGTGCGLLLRRHHARDEPAGHRELRYLAPRADVRQHDESAGQRQVRRVIVLTRNPRVPWSLSNAQAY